MSVTEKIKLDIEQIRKKLSNIGVAKRDKILAIIRVCEAKNIPYNIDKMKKSSRIDLTKMKKLLDAIKPTVLLKTG